jgi:hypothetical protein
MALLSVNCISSCSSPSIVIIVSVIIGIMISIKIGIIIVRIISAVIEVCALIVIIISSERVIFLRGIVCITSRSWGCIGDLHVLLISRLKNFPRNQIFIYSCDEYSTFTTTFMKFRTNFESLSCEFLLISHHRRLRYLMISS